MKPQIAIFIFSTLSGREKTISHAMVRIPKDSFWCSASPTTLFDTVSHCLCVCEAGQSVDSHSLKDLQGFSCVCPPPISHSVRRSYRYVLLHAVLPEFQGSELSLSLLLYPLGHLQSPYSVQHNQGRTGLYTPR